MKEAKTSQTKVKKEKAPLTVSEERKRNFTGLSILIAVLALGATFVQLYWTRVQFIKSSRPYVCVSNYQARVPALNTIAPEPRFFFCAVLNSPAKIKLLEVRITLDSTELFSQKINDIIRYPTETIEWTTEIRIDKFNEIMNRSPLEKAKLKRIITINYTPIDGDKTYHYKMVQSFVPDNNQWEGFKEEAD